MQKALKKYFKSQKLNAKILVKISGLLIKLCPCDFNKMILVSFLHFLIQKILTFFNSHLGSYRLSTSITGTSTIFAQFGRNALVK
jgi:hypothetical protein